MTNKKKSGKTEPIATEDNVDKIREILFGGQMKDYEGRFKRLEEKMTREAQRLAQEMEDKIKSIEKFMRKEIDLKTEQLQQEREARLEGLKGLDQALQSFHSGLNDKLEQLETGNRSTLSDTRREFHDEISILQTRLSEQQESLTRAMEEETELLRNDKVSLNALSGMFSELSMRLNGEFSIPDEK